MLKGAAQSTRDCMFDVPKLFSDLVLKKSSVGSNHLGSTVSVFESQKFMRVQGFESFSM